MWSINRWFPLLPCHDSDSDVELVFITATVKTEKLEALKLSLWIHSPALHFGTIPLFSRSRAAVREEASTYTQLNAKALLLQLVRM